MEYKINTDAPLPVNSNNTVVQIVSVDIEHQTIVADNSTFKHVATHLNVAYRISFNGAHEAHGAMHIYKDGYDIDTLSLREIRNIVRIRLGL